MKVVTRHRRRRGIVERRFQRSTRQQFVGVGIVPSHGMVARLSWLSRYNKRSTPTPWHSDPILFAL